MSAIFTDKHGFSRCAWCEATEQYQRYHDEEWGFPVVDDQRLFEKICLEGFQSGLSWRTILAKRENFRQAFAHFDFYRLADFDSLDVERLLQNEGIVRHRGKIEATINNAKQAIALCEEYGSLAAFFWQFETDAGEGELPASTQVSKQLSKQLKQRGWKFVGPTTAYAFMQAMGLVNDHHPACAVYKKVQKARENFTPPVPFKG